MQTIADYRITEKIHESVHTLLYRGYKTGDDTPVIIKIPNAEYPTVGELVRLRNQYAIAKDLNGKGIVKSLSLERDQNGFALILEDYGGISLKDYIISHPLSITDFLYIGIQVAEALETLYQNRIIHKDIKPDNILIHPLTKLVKVTDFSISSRLPKETLTLVNPNALEGTLAYISPEQTGRMNRLVDYRTDFYSLGVTFYELLTGRLPFVSTDAMEIVHYHIAKQPVPPNQVVPGIPQAIADIVMKLMAKNAEARYQTARGLKTDLEACLHQLQTTGQIQPFAIAQGDIAPRFQIPEKLYGRSWEIERLMRSFERVSMGRSELMLVAGYSGIGKSALVQEVHKPILAKRGYFISGKFDQFKRNIPFAPLIKAFQDLIRYHILTESPQAIATWKQKLGEALDKQGQVIIEVIPEVELLLGKQPSVPELPAAEAQNRFNRSFQKFIRVFASANHPLVLFLDDLQWADMASLQLLELLLSQADLNYLFVIGAYRNNEVSPVHPLMLTLDRIEQTKIVSINRIEVPPLNQEDLNQLVADALSCPQLRSQPLSKLVFQKTEGNPFFVTQFLKSLYEDHLLEYDGDSGYWQCDITQVKSLAVSENIVEFMATQLQRLSPPTQAVLKLAACIGHQFDLATLAIVYQQSPGETSAQLWEALQAGMVIPVSELYKFFQSDSQLEGEDSPEIPSVQYKFLHDRVQQAAYSLIPDGEKQATHLKLGRLLLENTPPEALEEKLFDLVNQLNIGAELIEGQPEKYHLATLNLQAGHKAKAATAYEPALRYLNSGLELLEPTSWGDCYDLTLQLHVAASESAYLSTDFDRMESLAEIVIEKATGLLDQIQVYEVKIQAYTAKNQQLDALATAREALNLLGVSLPEQPSFADIQGGLGELFSRLNTLEISALSDLPKMTDGDKKAAMRILNSAITPAYQSAPLLLPLLVFEEVKLSLQYGNTDESAYAYACFGLILCGIVGDIETGHQFGQLALTVLGQSKNQKLKSRTVMVVNNNVRLWKEPLQATISPLVIAYESGLETGDLEYAGLSAYNYCINSYFAGKELGQLEAEMTSYSQMMEKLKQTSTLNYQKMYWQVVSNLIRGTADPGRLAGELYHEDLMLPLHEQTSDRYAICCLYLHKLILSFLFRQGEGAFENAEQAAGYLDGLTAVYPLPLFHFYESLAALGVYANRPESDQEILRNKVEENQAKMKKWAEFSPNNFLHKYELVEAEKARVLGDIAEAIAGYDRAILQAQKSGYIQEEALANELAGEFHLGRGSQQIAQFYLTEAYYGYARWSATAKVKFLEQKYPSVLARVTQRAVIRPFSIQETISSFSTSHSSITQDNSQALDMTTVIKAASALSEELVLDKFLNKLMRVILENAGAQTGFLILEQDGKQVVQATGNIDESTITTAVPSLEINCTGIPLNNVTCLPLSIINYVHRTAEVLVINNAAVESMFTTDPYISTQKPKSILCFPIIYKGKTVAILYLENNLSAGVFTRDRLEVLKLLSSQAAISLENARLYQNLEQSIHDLKEAQLQLVQTEKMSTLGQLVAGVAHEINNPLSFVHGNLNMALDYSKDLLHHLALYRKYYPNPVADIQNHAQAIDLNYVQEDFPEMLRSMNLGTDRIKEIVKSLKNFSRKDAGVFQKADIHAGLDSTLLILSNRLKATGSQPAITVIKDYGKIPLVQCYPGQLNQVFMNLIANAIDALESLTQSHSSLLPSHLSLVPSQASLDHPVTPLTPQSVQKVIRIRTEVIEDFVAIHIADNGSGMTEEIQQNLFNTFFTTKPEGKGTGLGLSISHQIIVERHKGQIICTSRPGEGTEFTLEIPIQHENRVVQSSEE